METYSDNWNACLLFRNKQLTKQLKNYQEASALVTLQQQKPFKKTVRKTRKSPIVATSSASVLWHCQG